MSGDAEGLRVNIRVLSATSFLSGAYLSMMQVVWQPFALSVGATMAFVGFLEGVGGRTGVVTVLVQPIGGWLSDRLGRKIFMIVESILTITSFTLYISAHQLRDLYLLIPAMVFWGAASVSFPAFQSTVAESVEVHRRGGAYSTVAFFLLLPGFFTSMLAGLISDRLGYGPVFYLGLLLEGVVLTLILLLLKETLKAAGGRLSFNEFKAYVAKIARPRKLRGFYLAMAVDMFARGIGVAILFGMLKITYGFSNFQLGVLAGVFYLTWAAFQLPAGRLVDRYGSRSLLIFSEAVGVLMLSGWIVFKSFEAFIILQILNGLLSAAWFPSMQTYLANSVPKDSMAGAMGTLATYRGLIGLPAPLIGGILFDIMGFYAPMSMSLVGTVLALLMILVFVSKEAS